MSHWLASSIIRRSNRPATSGMREGTDRVLTAQTGLCRNRRRASSAASRRAFVMPENSSSLMLGPRTQRCALAASPSYLEGRRRLQHPSDVLDHECIRLRFSSGAYVLWEFEREDEALTVDPQGRLVVGVDAAAAAIDFARSSRGLIYTFENWLKPHLASGDLEPVLPEWWTTFDGPSLYFSRRFMPAPLRAFIDFFGSEWRD